MNLQQWASCADPEPMLASMDGKATGQGFQRFTCACARRVWHLLVDPRSQQAVELGEAWARSEPTGDLAAASSDALAASVDLSHQKQAAQETAADIARLCVDIHGQ